MQTISTIFTIASTIILVLFAITSMPRTLWMFSLFLKKKPEPAARRQHCYSILICARNEQDVIARLLRSIREQHYPPEKIKVFVMADNCEDETARIAKEEGATVYERFNKERIGKGFALEVLFQELKKDDFARKCKGFILFDADNMLDPHFMEKMDAAIDSGYELCKGFRNTLNFGDGFVAASHGLYFMSECSILDRGRSRLNCTSFITGTGFFVSRKIIEAEGGWHYFTLSEDTELTADQLLKGYKAGYCHDAIFYDEQPTKMRLSLLQRKRWIRGTTQVFDRYWKKLLRGFGGKNWLSCLDLFGQTITSCYLTGIGFLIVILDVLYLLFFQSPLTAAFSMLGYLTSLYWIFFLLGLLPLLFCWDRIPLKPGRKIITLCLFPFYMMTFLPLAAYVMFTGKIGWDPIVHGQGKVLMPEETKKAGASPNDAISKK